MVNSGRTRLARDGRFSTFANSDGTFLKAGAFDSLGIEASAHHSCAAFGPLACGSIVRMTIILLRVAGHRRSKREDCNGGHCGAQLRTQRAIAAIFWPTNQGA